MSNNPSTPVARNRTVSFLSSSKVRSAFKSPLRSPVGNSSEQPKTTPTRSRAITSRKRSSLTSAFNSPLKAKSLKREEIKEEDIEKLRLEIEAQEKEIASLRAEGLDEKDLDIHIELLHEYNEIKDVGQLVIGRLAVQKKTTTKELYPEFGLKISD